MNTGKQYDTNTNALILEIYLGNYKKSSKCNLEPFIRSKI